MDPFLIFLTVVISILSVVMLVVGIYVIMILRNLNKTLKKANQAIEASEFFFHNLTNPLSDLKSLGQGVRTGLSVAEHIVKWVKNKSDEQ